MFSSHVEDMGLCTLQGDANLAEKPPWVCHRSLEKSAWPAFGLPRHPTLSHLL